MLNEIRIEQRNNCSLVYGRPSPHQHLMLSAKHGEGRRYDPDVARLTGAHLAIGSLDDLNQLHREISDQRRAAFIDRYSTSGLSEAAVEWLLSGRQDLSSATMFATTTGIIPDSLGYASPLHHPDRAADLAKCIALEDTVPEVKDNFNAISNISSAWGMLAQNWMDLRRSCLSEIPSGADLYTPAPRTEDLLRKLLAGDEPGGFRLHAELFE